MRKSKQHAARPSPVSVYLSELAEGSKRTMRFGLSQACRFWGGAEPDTFLWVDQIAALRSDLAGRLAPHTANRVLAAVKGVPRTSWRMGLMSPEDLCRRVEVRPVKGGAQERGRCLTRPELASLFRACGGKRDAAALDLADYDPDTGALRIRAAKGSKSREVYLTKGSTRAVDAWLKAQGAEPGPHLVPVDQFGVMTIRRLHHQAMYESCKRLARRAGVTSFSPHDLRRTFAGDMPTRGRTWRWCSGCWGTHPSPRRWGTTGGPRRRPGRRRGW